MVILSWNVQGIGRPLTLQILRGLCTTHRPLVVFLLETKNKRNTLERIRKSLQFHGSSYVDPIGRSGGLALWWKEQVDLDVRFKSKNIIRCIISWPNVPNRWLASFVYAPSLLRDRVRFWSHLRCIAQENQYPWFCVGDLNEVASVWEKEGGEECRRSRIEQFQQLISDCDLIDLEFKGPEFTWSNNPGGSADIRERLDRALASISWRLMFPLAQVFHEVAIGSDHCPLVIKLCIPLKKVPYQFKFESMWATSEECPEVIAKAWDFENNGSAMFKLTQSLRRCRTNLKTWSKSTFGNNRIKIQELSGKLRDIQALPHSSETFEIQKTISRELELTHQREEMYLHQRSRVNWLNYGDKNTAFFHATVTQRRQRNQMCRIKDESGVWLLDDSSINGHLQSYYTNLFQASGGRDYSEALMGVEAKISEDVNRMLIREVNIAEIKLAIKQLGSLKAPGPDGFPGFFYHNYWNIVGEKVCEAIKHFFSNGFLLKELNLTNLVLIPKVQAPESLTQYRPISLCNFTVKIITKILANRLKGILNELISPNQSAFVPSRMIQDNIIIAHEIFEYLKRIRGGKGGFMALKLDFNKAYDRVEWDFLEALLRKLGFHEKWINWVMQCVSTVKFAVCVNGETRAHVIPTRGLRQGDPLSPYLFLLVKDVLSNMLNRAIVSGQLSGIRINRHCPTLSHIFFADDALLFAKAELGECRKLKEILEYGLASGQSINLDKSGVMFSTNVQPIEKHLILSFLNIPQVKSDAKYLGLPSFWGRSRFEAYTFLVEKALKKMQGWKNKLVSQAGKETLIKDVVQAGPTYAMACFLLKWEYDQHMGG